jgi:hypothetical protein
MVTPRGGGRKTAKGSQEDEPRAIKMAKGLEEEHKKKKEETAPSMKPEEDRTWKTTRVRTKSLHQLRISQKQQILLRLLLFRHQKEMYRQNRVRNSFRR